MSGAVTYLLSSFVLIFGVDDLKLPIEGQVDVFGKFTFF